MPGVAARTGRLAAIRRALGARPPGLAALEAYRARQLDRVIGHAQAHVPFYRRRFAGLAAGRRLGAADLAALPLTAKADRLEVPASELLAEGVRGRRLVRHTTSGSTGEPTVVQRTVLEEHLLGAFRLRALRWMGARAVDRTARVGLVRPGGAFASPVWRALQALGRYRLEEIDVRLPVETIVARLEQVRPTLVTGFAGAVSRVAEELAGRGPTRVRPRLVVVGGEVLTRPMRAGIEAAFGAPVREWYGSHEFNLLAWECAATGLLHVCDDAVLVEVLRDGGPVDVGERGEVVVTGLHSFAMPFVRYRLGDVATRGPAPCPCGAPFSTLQGIQGRMHDMLVLADGRTVHPYEVILDLYDQFAWLGRYQVVQERAGQVRLLLCPRAAPPAATAERLAERVRRRLGTGVREVSVELVAAIDPGPDGKLRVARSLVRSAYDAPGAGSR